MNNTYRSNTMKKKTIEEAAEEYLNNGTQPNDYHAFMAGAEWYANNQSEQMYGEEDIIGFLEFIGGTYSFGNILGKWYLHQNTSKDYTSKELLQTWKESKK